MKAKVRLGSLKGPVAESTILGHNLEVHGICERKLLSSNLLSNPSFADPFDPATGLAHEWKPRSSNYHGVRFQRLGGEGLTGGTAQLIHSYASESSGVVQTGRAVRAGEPLEAVFWARAQHHPVKIRLGFRPLRLYSEEYSSASVLVESPVFKEYKVELDVRVSDENCCFFIFLECPGMLVLDQMQIRPKGSARIRPELASSIAGVKAPLLRYPGGCLSTAYHWKHGLGPAHLRPVGFDPVFKDTLPHDFGTDEYLELCAAAKMIPHITANVGTGTAEEAGEWAAYCHKWHTDRGICPPLMYWQVGNEHYGSWEIGNMGPQEYVNVLRDYAPAIRKACPSARIVAIGNERCSCLGVSSPFRKTVLEKAGDIIDVVALQCYSICEFRSGDSEEARQKEAFEAGKQTMDKVRRAISDAMAVNPKLRVGMTEWSYWQQASHFMPEVPEPQDARHAIFAAYMIHGFASLAPSLELANYYQVRGGGFCLLSNRKGLLERTALYDVFELYRDAFPGEIGSVSVSAADGPCALDAMLSSRDGYSMLFVINTSMRESAEVAFDGLTPGKGSALFAESPLSLEWQKASLAPEKGIVSIPPNAIARIEVLC